MYCKSKFNINTVLIIRCEIFFSHFSLIFTKPFLNSFFQDISRSSMPPPNVKQVAEQDHV